MNSHEAQKREYVHVFFNLSLIIKAVSAAIEFIVGFFVLFISQATVLKVALFLTRRELLQDPGDFFAHYLIRSAEHFSSGSKLFIFVYLLSHAVIKLAVVVALIQRKLWAYPFSYIVLWSFVLYQMYRFYFTHSLWLILLTIFDFIVLWLIWKEHSYIKKDLEHGKL
jgi:uncharacterized membrane protein